MEIEAIRKFLTEEDFQIIERCGYGKRRGLGTKPALIVVDAQFNFVGENRPILESIERYSLSIGSEAWSSLEVLQRVLKSARQHGVPIVYALAGPRVGEESFSASARKGGAVSQTATGVGRELPPQIEPRPGDIIIEKRYASAFFNTHLARFLFTLGVDTLLVTGYVTSGCVRATVVDGTSWGFSIGVIRDCVRDRFWISHVVSLFDIDMKYGDVMSAEEAVEYMSKLGRRNDSSLE